MSLKFKSLGFSALFVAVMMLFQTSTLVFTDVYQAYTRTAFFSRQENQFIIVAISEALTVLFIYLIMIIRNKKPDLKRNFLETGYQPLLMAVISGISLSGFISILMGILNNIDFFTKYFEQYGLHVSGIDLHKYFLMQSIIIWVIIPVLEEIIFRGFILGELKRAFKPFWAVLLQAALFGLVHFEPIQSTYTFLAALFFGFVYIKTGKLTLSILMHAAFNIVGTGSDLLGNDNAVMVLYLTSIPLMVFTMVYFTRIKRSLTGG